MNTIEERALEIYPEKIIQWGNYWEDMNGLSRITYIRGAEEQQKLDIHKACKEFERFLKIKIASGAELTQEQIYRNMRFWMSDFRKAMEE